MTFKLFILKVNKYIVQDYHLLLDDCVELFYTTSVC